jgi:hypothetical protein
VSRIMPDLEKSIRERIAWLREKEQEQRRVGGPELLLGRTQGNIGSLEWVLRQSKEATLGGGK